MEENKMRQTKFTIDQIVKIFVKVDLLAFSSNKLRENIIFFLTLSIAGVPNTKASFLLKLNTLKSLRKKILNLKKLLAEKELQI